jgi:hypothetical protein
MTVASGSGEAVADEGRKIPVAVFYSSVYLTIKKEDSRWK